MENDSQILREFSKTRNLKQKTIYQYKDVIKLYTQYNQMTLTELLNEAETEEDQGIRWKNRKLKKRLLGFRAWLNTQYRESTVKSHFTRIKAIYNHYDIEIHNLPPVNTKNVLKSEPLTYNDLPSKEIIQDSLKISKPLMRAIILFMTSSGCARRETLNLTIEDFIKATKDYHNSSNIQEVIQELFNSDDVIPTWKIRRQKTNRFYITFSSPESTSEILNYLINTNRHLKLDSPLFKINTRYLNNYFKAINNKLNLGKAGIYNKMRSHNLRKFHASNLYNYGMSLELVDALQGRSKTMTQSSYFYENIDNLKEKYIEYLPAILINTDVNNLDIKSPEYLQLEKELEDKNEEVNDMNARLNKLEQLVFHDINLNDVNNLKNKL